MSTSRRCARGIAVWMALLAMFLGSTLLLSGTAAAQPETEIYNFLQINVTEADGDTVTFLPGQELCLAVTVSPPLTPGGTPWITHCYSTLPNQTLHANNPGTPFLRSSNYSIAVASNTTGCAVTVPAMSPADYGPGSGWYAIFNVVADCPDTPLPATSTSVPTATTEPTATLAPTATTVPAATYDLLAVWFIPVGSTPPVLPGAVCVLIVADPPFVGTSLYEFCSTSSSTNSGFGPDPGESFPTSSTYSAMITSNASGCLVTTAPLREGRGDSGFVGIIDVLIDCDSAPDSTATPTPTAPASGTATTVATATPTATVPVAATSTPTATATMVATEGGTSTATLTPTGHAATETMLPTEPRTEPVSTDPAPTSKATTPGNGPVTGLPTTGAGPLGVGAAEVLLIVGGLVLLLAACSMYWWRVRA